MTERTRLKYITGGSIDEDLESPLFASATLHYAKRREVELDDVVRIYALDASGRHALFTGIASLPSETLNEAHVTGDIKLRSMLAVLEDDKCLSTFTVRKGTPALAAAVTIIADAGLQVSALDDSTVLNANKSFEAGTSWLEIATFLCDAAGFRAPHTDAYGVVQFARKTDENTRPSVTFQDNETSIMLADVPLERSEDEVANVVVARLTGASTLSALAINDDAQHPYSTVARGRKVVKYIDVAEVAGVSTAVRKAELQRLADEELAKITGNERIATITHAWIPYALGSRIALKYALAKTDLSGIAISRSIQLEAGALTTVKVRYGGESWTR